MKPFLSLLAFFIFTTTLAASDTVYSYFNRGWKPCDKDSAVYVGKQWKQDDVWKRRDVRVKTNILQMEGDFLDKEGKTRVGTFTWYDEKGNRTSTTAYDMGKKVSADYYYESGKKRGHISFDENGTASTQTGWDEDGVEIKGYIVEQEATFPGGIQGWIKYLTRNLRASTAVDAGARRGKHTVWVQFAVDVDGSVSDIHAVQEPRGCKPCTVEAIRVITLGPNWVPAIQLNKTVKYNAVQPITFLVSEE